jgi:7,8-dihydropterin-6-yl-methyl-4-(beta-D-ribofuranosyl)aminobenzene 5'-phosphate synthase
MLRHRVGLLVLLGCAHAGVVDTLAWIKHLFPEEPLIGIAGGMHLDGAAPETIQVVFETLQRSPFLFVAPGHCTGSEAKQAILSAFGHRYRPLYVGMEIHINGDGRLEHQSPST